MYAKRGFALLLAVMLCLSLSLPVWANGESEEEVSEPIAEASDGQPLPAQDGKAVYEGKTVQPFARAESEFVEEPATPLHVIVDAGYTGVTYQWEKAEENEHGHGPGTYTSIPGEVGETYLPTENGQYGCLVTGTDPDGETESTRVTFDFFVDPRGASDVTVYPEGATEDTSGLSLTCSPGERITLTVVVKTAPGVDESKLHFQWYELDQDWNSRAIPGETGKSLTVTVKESKAYEFRIAEYGHAAEVQFSVEAASFSAEIEGSAPIVRSYEFGNIQFSMIVDKGGPATLEAVVTYGDPAGLTYRWWTYDNDRNQVTLGTDAVLKVESVTEYTDVYLKMTAPDGYQKSFFGIRIVPDNGFSVRPEGAEDGDNYVHISAQKGDTVELRAVVTADDTSGLGYQWGYIDEGGRWNSIAYNGQSDTLTVENIPASLTYFCAVYDGLGNGGFFGAAGPTRTGTVFFNIDLGGDAYGTMDDYILEDLCTGTVQLDADRDGELTLTDAVMLMQDSRTYDAVQVVRKIVGLV